MALSAATVSSLFPASMRIRVAFRLPDVSMPWYWWNDNVVCAEVRESNQQLLILINRARVVGYHDRLPHPFDPQGFAEAPVRIKLAPKFAQSHGVFEPMQQPSN